MYEYANNRNKYGRVVYPELSYKLNGIFFEVHNVLGRYCREKQYCDAVEEVLKKNHIEYKREFCANSSDKLLDKNSNRADFIIENKILVEVKAKRFISREEYYQTQRYLKAFNLKLGIILNFNQQYLTPRRILNSSAKENY